jgi:hypothetical protein
VFGPLRLGRRAVGRRERGTAVRALPACEGVRGLQLVRPARDRAAVRLYGAERIVCGTDGTEFGCEWTNKALAEAEIGEEARAKILHRNAAAMMSRLAKVAQRETAAA